MTLPNKRRNSHTIGLTSMQLPYWRRPKTKSSQRRPNPKPLTPRSYSAFAEALEQALAAEPKVEAKLELLGWNVNGRSVTWEFWNQQPRKDLKSSQIGAACSPNNTRKQ